MATGTVTANPRVPRLPAPNLSDVQKQLILTAAGAIVRATTLGQQAILPDPTLGGVANVLVSGVFVTLKRGKHLRACTGSLGQPLSLIQALHEASMRTAIEDVRFPPVSPIELEHLSLDVWLLYNLQRMEVRGEERVRAVTVGQHGLQVVRGQSRGLLLPGVATENGWDSRRFLEQVCVKAGMHPSLWKDDGTMFFTFEGEELHGKVPPAGTPEGEPTLKPEHLKVYTNFFRTNVAAHLSGATPSYYLTGAPDGTVTGLVTTIRRPGVADAMHFSQLSMRPGIPLQTSLFSMAQTVARTLASQRLTPADFQQLHFGVTVLTDAAMHGTVADPELTGIDPQHRAVLVLERNKAGIAFEPAASAEQLIQKAAEEAQVTQPPMASVFSLGAVTTEADVFVSTVPRPVRGPAERPPAVAGSFYPADAAELTNLVDELIGAPAKQEEWAAAMVPHAGLRYSGAIAAGVLKRLKFPSTIIIIGPKHTPQGVDWAVAPQQTWSLPNGTIESDFVLARKLCEAIPGLQLDALAHQREHGIEVELPFLAKLAPQSRVLGIAIGAGDLESCREFARSLAKVIRERKERPLLLISSDMNHFATDAETRKLDELALSAMQELDPQRLYETVTENRISMCGLLPAVIVMETLRQLGGLKRASRAGYGTSADVTQDTSRVVGYAGMLLN